jgi:hypothetical protein
MMDGWMDGYKVYETNLKKNRGDCRGVHTDGIFACKSSRGEAACLSVLGCFGEKWYQNIRIASTE